MSAEELASALFVEFGYLIYPSRRKRKVGEIIPHTNGAAGFMGIPVRIIGMATKAQLLNHEIRGRYLAGLEPYDERHQRRVKEYLYRVEALD